MNKNLFLSLIALAVLLSASCKKVKDALQKDFDITPDAIEATVPPVTTTDETTVIGTFTVDMNLDSLVNSYTSQFGIGNIKSIKITSFKVALLNANASNNISNFESASAEISAPGQGAKVLVQSNNIPDTYAESLTLPVTGGDIELKDYVKATTFNYVLRGKARRTTSKELRVKVTAQYTFTFGL